MLAGLIVLVRPGESVVAIAWVVGFWWVLAGVMQLIGGIVEPAGRGWNIALGVARDRGRRDHPRLARASGSSRSCGSSASALILRGAAEIAAGLGIRKLHKEGEL